MSNLKTNLKVNLRVQLNKFLEPIFETNKERQSAFDNSFNNFYEKESFQWSTRTFSFLPDTESLKIQALYAKMIPYFECASLVHIHNKGFRILKKDIFMQKQDITQAEVKIDFSKIPFYQWVRLSSENSKNELLEREFGISCASKFQVLVFRIRPDYALMISTAQANPWLKFKLDALAQQICLGFCDGE